MKKRGLPVSVPAARPVTRCPQTPVLVCRYYLFYMAVFVFPPLPSPSLESGHPLRFVHIGVDRGMFLKSTASTRSPHIVVILAPLWIMAIIILLLLLPVSIVPVPIAAILALVIVSLAPTLVVVVRLMVLIDVVIL